MKLGVRLPYHCAGVTGEQLAAVAKAADQAGMHSGWVADHVVFPAGEVRSTTAGSTRDGRYPRPMDETTLEAWTTLTWAAAVTTDLVLAVGVCVLPQRNPLVLAKQIATLDVLSGGRVWCGAGIGWLREEFDALGVPWARRAARTEDTMALMRAAWAGSPVTYDGDVVSVPEPVHFVPRPAAPVPILLGGHSEPALRRAATLGDGWIGHELMSPQARATRTELERLGASPHFRFVVSRLMNPPDQPGADDRRLDTESSTRLAGVFADYADAGVDVLLCEPSVRTVDAHLRLIDQVHAAGERTGLLRTLSTSGGAA
ncbi:TIGR03619 family F420-dependent LLM class oxidoreductase [Pseudonocardia sp. RS010]|uniref:TIGR03619 family F420-dependent LLM class oxidoreductase n=1 Tax=Pseudonocardia sp. RS010 TaxID=3385979 RepID=UPI0039A066A6